MTAVRLVLILALRNLFILIGDALFDVLAGFAPRLR
jgi:hypothetical protein